MRDVRRSESLPVAGAPYQGRHAPLSKAMQADVAVRPVASESLLASLEASRLARIAGHKPEPVEPVKARKARPARPAKRLQTARSERGTFQSDDVETLLLNALAEADAWQAYVSRPGYKGELTNKPETPRKRKRSSGGEVSMAELAGFAPATFHADPPVSLSRVEYRTVRGMAIATCLSCGEALRRLPDSDRPCPRCRGRFFAWESRETDSYIGEDYSLPAHWYGDLTGVSAHYTAVERMVNEPVDRGGAPPHERCRQAKRLIPTGPQGTMRWLTTQAVPIGPKRGRKSKAVAYFAAVAGSTDALFYDGASAAVEYQK